MTKRSDAYARRRRRLIAIAVAVLATPLALGLALRALVATPFGADRVEAMLDGADLGGFGRLDVEDVRGDILGRFEIARATVSDAEGVWLELDGVSTRWRPRALLGRKIAVEAVGARRLAVLRAPLSPPRSGRERPKSGVSGWSIDVEAARLDRIELDAAIAGTPVIATLDAGLNWSGQGAGALTLDARRLDDGADAVRLEARRDAAGEIKVEARLEAPAGGFLASALKAPETALSFAADASGDASFAEGRLVVRIDGASAGALDLRWGDDRLAVKGELALLATPWTREAAAILGEALKVQAALEARRDGGARVFAIDAQTPQASIALDGRTDLAERRLLGDARVVARGQALAARLEGLGEIGFDTAVFEGLVGLEPTPRVSGALNADGLVVAERSAERASASMNLVADDAGRWGGRIAANLDGVSAGEAVAALLGSAVQGALEFAVDAPARRLRIDAAQVTGANANLEAQGDWSWSGEAGALTGTAQVRSVAPWVADAAGGADLTWRLSREPAGPATFSATASGRALAAPGALGEALGPEPDLTISGFVDASGVTLDRATLSGARLEADGEGAYGADGSISARTDFALDGPLALGPLALDGALGGAATLSGTLDASELRAQVEAPMVILGAERFERAVVRIESNGGLTDRRARVEIEAGGERGPLRAAADLIVDDGVVSIEDLAGRWAGLAIDGGARLADGVARGTFTLDHGPSGAQARARLGGAGGAQTLDFEASIAEAGLGEGGRLEAAALSLKGPIDDLAVAVSASGERFAPFDLKADGRLRVTDGGASLSVSPRGDLAGEALATQEAVVIEAGGQGVRVNGRLRLGQGGVAAAIERRDGRTTVDLDVDDAPLAVLALAQPELNLDGALSLDADLSGAQTLSGGARLAIRSARPADRPELAGLNADFDVELDARGALVEARASSEGFSAAAEGRAPLRISAVSLAPRLDPGAAIDVRARADGDVASLVALAAPSGVEFGGRLAVAANANGAWSSPVWTGTLRFEGGRLYDRRSGLSLEDLAASGRFDGPELALDRVSASDGADGRLNGSGRFALDAGGARGSIEAGLRSLRTGIGPQSEAVIDGDIGVEISPETRRVRGTLVVERADITPPEAGAPGTVSIDVIELNRPENLDPPPAPKGEPFALDVQASAARRVFVRAPGLSTEWGFDVVATGSTDAPLIKGSASLIKGELEIGGERFVFDEAEVTLNGPLEAAEVSLVARREAADLVALVSVTGSAARPTIKLTSRPAYPEDEILARVLFGRSAAELSAFEAAQLAAALAQLAGGKGLDLVGSLRAGLGVDRLSVSRGAQGQGPIVSGGKYIAEDVYLEVASSSAAGAPEARLEWEIRPRFELVSRFGAAREAAISLRWRRDY